MSKTKIGKAPSHKVVSRGTIIAIVIVVIVVLIGRILLWFLARRRQKLKVVQAAQAPQDVENVKVFQHLLLSNRFR
jgi:cytochrome c-type biogenesis protein CcmH/NrfF